MKNPNVRSLNLATSVGIVMYHMLALYDFGEQKSDPGARGGLAIDR
jgi:tRNA(Leu) C34 or U34 (ribose-2'-O)-methylase TrmL